MKKYRVIILTALLVIAASSLAFGSTGLGVSAGIPIGLDLPGSNVMLSLKLSDFPLLMGVGLSLGQQTDIGLTGDYWITNPNIASILNWYIGVGGYVGLGLGSSTRVDLGVRVPIGINMFILDGVLELFLEVAPTIGIGFGDVVRFPQVGAQGALGFRVWF